MALSKASKVTESIEDATHPTDDKPESSDIMTVHSDWGTLFMTYLKTGGLPEHKDKWERLRRHAGHYTLVDEELFRGSANGALMSYPVFMPKPNTHRMYAQDQLFHIYG
jgi:hypothetical protein